MRTSAAGSSRGFSLLELMVVVAIITLATTGVALALRDNDANQLEQEAQRLASLLDAARAKSRASGVPVRWRVTSTGFEFLGLPASDGVPPLPAQWLDARTSASAGAVLNLGPEPLIGAQSVAVRRGERTLNVRTDGLRPFVVQP